MKLLLSVDGRLRTGADGNSRPWAGTTKFWGAKNQNPKKDIEGRTGEGGSCRLTSAAKLQWAEERSPCPSCTLRHPDGRRGATAENSRANRGKKEGGGGKVPLQVSKMGQETRKQRNSTLSDPRQGGASGRGSTGIGREKLVWKPRGIKGKENTLPNNVLTKRCRTRSGRCLDQSSRQIFGLRKATKEGHG